MQTGQCLNLGPLWRATANLLACPFACPIGVQVLNPHQHLSVKYVIPLNKIRRAPHYPFFSKTFAVVLIAHRFFLPVGSCASCSIIFVIHLFYKFS